MSTTRVSIPLSLTHAAVLSLLVSGIILWAINIEGWMVIGWLWLLGERRWWVTGVIVDDGGEGGGGERGEGVSGCEVGGWVVMRMTVVMGVTKAWLYLGREANCYNGGIQNWLWWWCLVMGEAVLKSRNKEYTHASPRKACNPGNSDTARRRALNTWSAHSLWPTTPIFWVNVGTRMCCALMCCFTDVVYKMCIDLKTLLNIL